MRKISFFIRSNNIEDYKEFIILADRYGFNTSNLENLRIDDQGKLFVKKFGVRFQPIGIGIISDIPDHVVDTKFDLCSRVFLAYENYDIAREVLKSSDMEKYIRIYKHRLRKFKHHIQGLLKDKLKKYPYFEIGEEVYSDMDVKYRWIKELGYTYFVILGYTYFSSGWEIRTQKGYSFFETLNPRYKKKIRKYKLKKIGL